jgi:hypothetical protein
MKFADANKARREIRSTLWRGAPSYSIASDAGGGKRRPRVPQLRWDDKALGMTRGEGGASPWHVWRWMHRAQRPDFVWARALPH